MQLFKKNYESGCPSDLALRTIALIISNKEMEHIMKPVKSPEESGLLIQGISKTIKNETKEQKGGLPSMLLRSLAASILGNTLAGRRVIGNSVETIRAGQNF